MSEEYRVPKADFEAEILVDGHAPLKVRLFLSDRAESHEGPERPSDLLTAHDAFFPALDSSTGSVLFIRRDDVMVLTVPAEHELGDESSREEMLASTQAVRTGVEVCLRNGDRITGTLTYVMPEGQTRVQDYLNIADPILVLEDGDSARIIRKAHAVMVTVPGTD